MREIQEILCPTDLSDVSRHAIDHAVLVADRYKARITALHVCSPTVAPAADFALAGAGVPDVLTDEIDHVREQVSRRPRATGAGR